MTAFFRGDGATIGTGTYFSRKVDLGMANLEVIACSNSLMYLIPERRPCFLFDQASSLQDSEPSEEVLLGNVLCK